jgi:DNA-directed RNA polymerase specialized sigma24 family protein
VAATAPPRRRSEDDDEQLRRFERSVKAILRARYPGFDESEVEDCFQQAFLEAWPKRDTANGSFAGLLTVTALRRASDHWRRHRSRLAPLADPDAALQALPDDHTLDPAERAQRRLELQRGAELLAMMPPHHQRIWRAYCDADARHNVKAVGAIAAAESLTPRQVTRVIDKVKEKARRIAAGTLTADLEHDAAFCARLEARIAAHLDHGVEDRLAAGHLDGCRHCRALFGRSREIERAAAGLLLPLPVGGSGGSLLGWVTDRLASAKARAFEVAARLHPTGRGAEWAAGAKAMVAAGALATAGGSAALVAGAGTSDEPPVQAVAPPARPAVPAAVRTTPAPARRAPRRAERPASPEPKPSPARTPPVAEASVPPASPPEPARDAPARPRATTPQPRPRVTEPPPPGDEFGIVD